MTGPGDKTRDEYLAECVVINDFALDEEFIRMPADMAYWNARYADALRNYLLAKLDHERNAARLHLRTKAANAAGGGRPRRWGTWKRWCSRMTAIRRRPWRW